jgi:TP901 family phage tail tape measure protein
VTVELGFGLAPDAKTAAEAFINMLNGQTAGVMKLSEAITNFNADGNVISQTFRGIAASGETVTVTLKEQQGNWQLLSGKVDEATASLKALEAQEKAVAAAARRNDANQAEQQLGGFLNRPGLNVNQINGMEAALQRVKAQIESGAVSLQRFQELYATISANPRALIPNMTAEEAAVTSSLRNIVTGLQKTGKTADDVAQKWYISWQGVVRLIEAQVVKRIAGFLQSGFAEGVKSAADFSIKIAEIETISQNAGLATSEWANGIRTLSSLFGKSQADVAEAAYQAVSNQVVKGAQTFDFLASAMKFAQATVSTTAQSVDLLSSALQSYNLTAGDTERVSAIFFKTIELGRVRAQDLSNTFGRIGPVAAQLGVSLEEVGASIATITTKGVKPAEALTLISNLMQKLIKPTDEMKALFDEWGVSSGQAAIQTFGFGGVLQKLDNEAQKGTARLGDLLGQIRSIRAAVSLTGNSFGDFQKNLAEISGGQDYYNKAAEIVGQSFGQRLQVQLNKAKVYFAEDFGQSVIKTAVQISEQLGGLDNALKSITTTLTPLAIAVGSYYTVLGAAKAATTAYIIITETFAAAKVKEAASTATATAATAASVVATDAAAVSASKYTMALTGISLFAATFAATFTIGRYLFSDDDVERAEKLRTSLEKIVVLQRNAASIDPQKQFDRNDARETEQRYTTLYQAVSTYYSKQNALAQDAKARAVANLQAVNETAKAAATSYLGGITQQINSMKEAGTQAKSIIQSSLKLAEDLPRRLGGDLFKEQLKNASAGFINPATGLIMDEQQTTLIRKRITELVDLAKRKYAEGTKESIEEARRLYSDAERLETELFDKETAIRKKEFDERVARGREQPTKFVYDPTTDQLKPIYEFKVKTSELEAKLNSMLQERLKLESQVRENAKVQLQDAQAQELAEKERLKTIQNALTAIQALTKEGEIKGKFGNDPTKALTEFDRQADIIREQASRKDLEAQITTAKFIADQRKALEQEIQADLSLQQIKGEQERTTIALNASKARIAKIKEDIEAATSTIQTEIGRITGALAKSALDDPSYGERVLFRAKNFFGDTEALDDTLRKVKELRVAAQAATDAFNTNSTEANLKKAQEAIKAYSDEARKLLALKQGKDVLDLDPQDQAVQRIREVELAGERMQDAFAARNAARDAMDAAKASADELGGRIGALPGIYEIFSKTTAASSQVVVDSLDAINARTVQMINNLDGVIRRMEAVRNSLPAIQQGAQIGEAGSNFFGRNPQYMNAGGFVGFVPRGSDTVPAMISRREMVMTEYAVNAFEPVLRAMNAGTMRPGDYSRNQTVNIGDIHVHGGNSSPETVRNIAKGLRREVRRGNISLT